MAPDVRISGCSIVRGARECDYPLAESLRSLLPLVEEMVVVVHRGDEGTRQALRELDDGRFVVVETDWDVGPRGGGRTLARQTNAALERCRHPWALYLQADEVIHEDDYEAIREAAGRYGQASEVDALSFRFLHFEGSYGYVNPLRYRRQCRLVKNDGRLQSVRDAAGFGRTDALALRTRSSGARIFHYGWAAPPAALKTKTLALARLYHSEADVARRWGNVPAHKLGSADLAFRWTGSHPAVMRARMALRSCEAGGARRPPFGTALLNPRFYAAWLRKWRLLPRW